ncbi:hypothetical protein, partial [Rummeliibacillus pycnus]|uniref:hypothetical protein n=1 Tax=Rummeliibacillus pycnus TaxID=101070 RepID=UPI003D2DE58A
PLCSPTFLVFKENLFNKYNIPYFTEVNLYYTHYDLKTIDFNKTDQSKRGNSIYVFNHIKGLSIDFSK